MLEYLSYKKFKKNKADKVEKDAADKGKGKEPEHVKPEPGESSAAAIPSVPTVTTPTVATPATPAAPAQILDDDEQRFLERLTSSSAHDDEADDGPKPALPPRVKTPDLTWDSDSESFRNPETATATATATATKEGGDKDKSKISNRLSILLRKAGRKHSSSDNKQQLTVPAPEADRETDDLTRVLDDLNLSAQNNKAFSLSTESTELLRKFTLVLKDLVNGVPTAVNDLTSLLDDPDGHLASNYEKLPKSLKKLVTQLPDKLSSTLAPELLAVAAEAQGMGKEDAAATAAGGIAGAAKRMLSPKNIKDLVTKPGAIVSMLKAIMNALKARWPAFMGTNVIWSLALFILLFVLWYCHKRGRETRLEREKSENVVDGDDRIEELPDDPTLPAPAGAQVVIEPPKETVRSPAAA